MGAPSSSGRSHAPAGRAIEGVSCRSRFHERPRAGLPRAGASSAFGESEPPVKRSDAVRCECRPAASPVRRATLLFACVSVLVSDFGSPEVWRRWSRWPVRSGETRRLPLDAGAEPPRAGAVLEFLGQVGDHGDGRVGGGVDRPGGLVDGGADPDGPGAEATLPPSSSNTSDAVPASMLVIGLQAAPDRHPVRFPARPGARTRALHLNDVAHGVGLFWSRYCKKPRRSAVLWRPVRPGGPSMKQTLARIGRMRAEPLPQRAIASPSAAEGTTVGPRLVHDQGESWSCPSGRRWFGPRKGRCGPYRFCGRLLILRRSSHVTSRLASGMSPEARASRSEGMTNNGGTGAGGPTQPPRVGGDNVLADTEYFRRTGTPPRTRG
jgi:hypothetical protein